VKSKIERRGRKKEQHIGYMKKSRFIVKIVLTFIYKHITDSKNVQKYLKLRASLKDIKLAQTKCSKLRTSTIDCLE
jgi:hypothetical protein